MSICPITEVVRNNVIRARKGAHFTQKQLASKLGMSETAVRFWEAGRREVSQEHVFALAGIFGRSWLWFYQDNDGELPVRQAGEPASSATSGEYREPSDEEIRKWNRARYKAERGLPLTDEERAFILCLQKDPAAYPASIGFNPSKVDCAFEDFFAEAG